MMLKSLSQLNLPLARPYMSSTEPGSGPLPGPPPPMPPMWPGPPMLPPPRPPAVKNKSFPSPLSYGQQPTEETGYLEIRHGHQIRHGHHHGLLFLHDRLGQSSTVSVSNSKQSTLTGHTFTSSQSCSHHQSVLFCRCYQKMDHWSCLGWSRGLVHWRRRARYRSWKRPDCFRRRRPSRRRRYQNHEAQVLQVHRQEAILHVLKQQNRQLHPKYVINCTHIEWEFIGQLNLLEKSSAIAQHSLQHGGAFIEWEMNSSLSQLYIQYQRVEKGRPGSAAIFNLVRQPRIYAAWRSLLRRETWKKYSKTVSTSDIKQKK